MRIVCVYTALVPKSGERQERPVTSEQHLER